MDQMNGKPVKGPLPEGLSADSMERRIGPWVWRIGIVALAALFGVQVGGQFLPDRAGLVSGGAAGALVGLLAVMSEVRMSRASPGSILGGTLGFFVGLAISVALSAVAGAIIPVPVRLAAGLLSGLIFAYIGTAVGSVQGSRIVGKGWEEERVSTSPCTKILDTSVIIDGRVADICESGFLEGTLVLPQFVLKELQQIADSLDSLKRNRGRSGLDILRRIQQNPDLDIRIVDTDYPRVREVDTKLVLLAKEIGAKVMTNDFNLNKVAELQGVTVLNINELANAVKPVVLPGEEMNVFVIKEGKEYGQGVAYLDDGTMVVVDHAKNLIGQNVEVSVTSVLQTTAGRMIFTKIKDEDESQRNGN
ncbi:MAG: TRAM domain-containing protein [Nitrospinota bacterium]|nr:TRAM domain-containing protein [Nitrospinota bacterium]